MAFCLLIAADTSYNMVWSPDGTRLALIRGADGVYLINADGTDPQHPVAINLNSCQALVLSRVTGEVKGWYGGGERSR